MIKKGLIFPAVAICIFSAPNAFAVPSGQIVTWADGTQGIQAGEQLDSSLGAHLAFSQAEFVRR